MLYKGENLDLVLPQGLGSGRAVARPETVNWLARALGPADGLPQLWVDQAVLQCCNQAYDLAVVHRAQEVGLEHLVHAMTLVADSIEVLRSYNVDVTALRQESAAIIASDRPMAYANGHASPTNSEEFVGVLRLAADRAYAQRSPITTEDVLDTLFDMKSDQSSRNLLSRHRADWRLRPEAEASFTDYRDRTRDEPTVTDDIQNTRLSELERLVHRLATDISQNKDAFAELIGEIRGNGAIVEPPRKPNGVYQPEYPHTDTDEIADRILAMQRSVESKFAELSRGWDILGERLNEVEAAVAKVPDTQVELDAVAVEAIVNSVVSRLEDKFKAVSGIGDLDDKIDKLEATLAGLPDRLIAMERRLAQAPTAVDLAPLTRQLNQSVSDIRGDLGDIEKRVNALSGAGGDIEPLLAMMDKIDRHVDDTGLLVQGFNERFDEIDKAVASQGVGGERIKALVDDAMANVAQTFRHQQDAIAEAVANAAVSKLSLVTDTINARESEQSRMLNSILGHVSQENGGVFDNGPIMAAINGVAGESRATHEALIKINTNQQTIAAAVDRLSSDMAEFSNLPRPVVDNGAAVDPRLAEEIRELKEAMRNRLDFWTRFRIWLYGTNDWYAASWGARQRD